MPDPKRNRKMKPTSEVEIQKENDGNVLARTTLSYIFTAKRPLTVDELLHALSVESGGPKLVEDGISDIQDSNLLISSGGLFKVDRNTTIVGLAEAPLQEYFAQNPDALILRSEAALAKACVIYLSFDVFKDGPCRDWNTTTQRLQKYPFLAYAASNWGSHFRECQDDEETSKLIRTFLVDHGKVSSSLQVMCLPRLALQEPQLYQDYPWNDRFPKEVTPLHAAAHFGLDTILAMLLSHGLTELIDTQDSHGRTALMSASANGHNLAVKLLLGQGASILLKEGEGLTALHLAVLDGHIEVAEVLLKHQDIDNSQRDKALNLAAERGDEQIVRLLLDSGADANGKDDAGNTALMFAVPQGRGEVARVLLEGGSDVDAKDIHDNTLLHWAIRYPGILQLLLESGANVHAKNHQGKAALHWAVQEGQTKSVRLLLQAGSEINAKDKHGFTPLHSAALKGHRDIVKLLLENDADPNHQDSHSWTPLHAALLNHHSSIINLLTSSQETITNLTPFLANSLTRPILVSLASQKSHSSATLSDSPLLRAINSTHHSLVLSALANPPPPSSSSSSSSSSPPSTYTPLTLSCHLGLFQISQTLLQNSFPPNVPDLTGHYPIHYATLNSDTALVELLISHGADIESRVNGSTPLLLASQQWFPLTADALVSQGGADVGAKDVYGRTVLHYAAEQESGRAVLRSAVNAKSGDVDVQDLWGRTLLFYAAEAGRVENMGLLLDELGARVASIAANDGTTALHVAAFVGDDGVTVARQLLLAGDVDVDVAARGGLTPLHVAVLRGHREVAKTLLESGADREAEWRLEDEGKNGEDELLSSPLLGVGEVLISRKARKLVAEVYGNSDGKAFTVRELAAMGGVVDILDIPVPEPGMWHVGRDFFLAWVLGS
ncbi:ankyrin repeat-containing domain protein [Cladorrhinum sp. PSN332]|nr:ankyrin repeat-containing domain protein [Cladorrhinum sp. PSN332]